ncbi:unnamed protein product [Urochloa humidicola]
MAASGAINASMEHREQSMADPSSDDGGAAGSNSSLRPSRPTPPPAAHPSMPASRAINNTMEQAQQGTSDPTTGDGEATGSNGFIGLSPPTATPAAQRSMPPSGGSAMADPTSSVLNAATTHCTSGMNQRKGKRPRTGLNYRIAPNEETTVAKTIRTASSRLGEPIFYPYEETSPAATESMAASDSITETIEQAQKAMANPTSVDDVVDGSQSIRNTGSEDGLQAAPIAGETQAGTTSGMKRRRG